MTNVNSLKFHGTCALFMEPMFPLRYFKFPMIRVAILRWRPLLGLIACLLLDIFEGYMIIPGKKGGNYEQEQDYI